MSPAPRIIQVAKVSKDINEKDIKELFATVCYYYPQYTLRDVKKLPYKHISMLLKVARKMEAMHYHNLAQIAAAPFSKKGSAVSKLLKHYAQIIKS